MDRAKIRSISKTEDGRMLVKVAKQMYYGNTYAVRIDNADILADFGFSCEDQPETLTDTNIRDLIEGTEEWAVDTVNEVRADGDDLEEGFASVFELLVGTFEGEDIADDIDDLERIEDEYSPYPHERVEEDETVIYRVVVCRADDIPAMKKSEDTIGRVDRYIELESIEYDEDYDGDEDDEDGYFEFDPKSDDIHA